MLQEAPQWDLTEENVMDLKEIFIMFDTDVDGVISIDQVSVHQNLYICIYTIYSIGVSGNECHGNEKIRYIFSNFQFLCLISLLIDEEILAQVKNVSADSKNNTLEFNEFIKMVALDMKMDATKNRDELFEAFRWN